MDQPGRRGVAGELSNVVHLPGQWPAAPGSLTASQAANWNLIVRTKPSDWFGADTYPLLVEYVRGIDAADVLARAMDEFDPEWMKDDAGLRRFQVLAQLQVKKAASLASLATKMRLAQQSRYTEKTAATAAKRAGSPKKPWE